MCRSYFNTSDTPLRLQPSYIITTKWPLRTPTPYLHPHQHLHHMLTTKSPSPTASPRHHRHLHLHNVITALTSSQTNHHNQAHNQVHQHIAITTITSSPPTSHRKCHNRHHVTTANFYIKNHQITINFIKSPAPKHRHQPCHHIRLLMRK